MAYAKIERYSKEDIRYILAFVLAVVFALTAFFFIFQFVLSASTFQTFPVHFSFGKADYTLSGSKIVVGPGTQNFLKKIKEAGSNPVAIAETKRSFFSVPGQIVTFGGDNITVFEYSDNGTALADLASFQDSTQSRLGAWKKNVNLYLSGNLIIFYMGENKEVTSSLDSVLGKPLAL